MYTLVLKLCFTLFAISHLDQDKEAVLPDGLAAAVVCLALHLEYASQEDLVLSSRRRHPAEDGWNKSMDKSVANIPKGWRPLPPSCDRCPTAMFHVNTHQSTVLTRTIYGTHWPE